MTANILSDRTRHRLDYLDSIRALAALGVALLHGGTSLYFATRGIEHEIWDRIVFVFDPGKIGVVIFFMVSGFLIPHSLKEGYSKKVALRDFLLSRFFRLYPAYWLSILAAFFVLFNGSITWCPWPRIFANLTMFQGFFANQTMNMIGVYWTLQIEWAFYLLCMGLFVMGLLRRPKGVLFAYFALLAVSYLMAVVRFKTHIGLPVAAPLGLSVMFAANLWRMVVLDRRVEAKLPMRLAIGSLLVSVPVIALLAYNFDRGLRETWYRYTLCYWIAILSFMLLTTKLHVTWKPLRILGQASFSFYLFNGIIITLYFRKVPMVLSWPGSGTLLMLSGILVSALCSLPLYYFIEKPLIAFGKKITRKLEYPGPADIDNAAIQSM